MTDLERINQAIEHVRNLGQIGGTYLYNTCETALEALRFQKAALGEVVIETICRRLHSQAYCNENVDSEWRDFEDNAGEILSDIRAELSKQVKENKE